MHRIIAQQMGVGFNRAEVVDRHNVDVLAARFKDRAHDIAPDTTETIHRDTNLGHYCLRYLKLGSRDL